MYVLHVRLFICCLFLRLCLSVSPSVSVCLCLCLCNYARLHLCICACVCLHVWWQNISILDQTMHSHGVYFETFRCFRACHEFQSWSAHASLATFGCTWHARGNRSSVMVMRNLLNVIYISSRSFRGWNRFLEAFIESFPTSRDNMLWPLRFDLVPR